MSGDEQMSAAQVDQLDGRVAFLAPAVLASVVGSLAIGGASSNVAPILVGALVDGSGFTESQVGLVTSAELCSVALATLLFSKRVATKPRVNFACIAAGVAILGHVVSSLVAGMEALVAARIVAGIGEGAVFAAGNAAIASAREPDRLCGAASVIGGGGSVGLLVLMPYATSPFGVAGAFLTLAGLTLVLLPTLRMLPNAPHRPTSHEGSASAHAPNRNLALVGLLAVLLFTIGQGAVWAFAERMGVGAGLSTVEVGEKLGIAMVCGLIGSGAATALGTQFGRALPLAVGTAIQAAAVAFLVGSETVDQYQYALMGWAFSFFFCLPYLIGIMAILDSAGRWTSAAAGLEVAGNGIGPFIGGLLLESSGYGALATLAIVTSIVCLGLMCVVLAGPKNRGDALDAG
jgi:predicted MFS family arabinose efflux permease